MAFYVIAHARNATDADKLAEYRRINTAVVERHGGRFLIRGGAIEVIEGGFGSDRIVLMEFPDQASARAWYEDPEYVEARTLRLEASETDVLFVEGA
jgi:uncharacterized protein (DUF1330 family)